MDFKSLMSQEISKARQQAPPKDEPGKKYQKRAEIEADRRAAYLASQRALEEERQAKAAAKRKREEEEAEASREREEKRRKLAEESKRRREEAEREEDRARRRRLGLPELTAEQETAEEVLQDDVLDDELVAKLREMGEPARLFGETHKMRLRRFRKLGVVVTDGPIPTCLELVDEKDMKVEAMPKDEAGRKFVFRQLASYFTMVLTEWEKALEKEKRDTFASKAAYNAMVQSKENMTPVSYFFFSVGGIFFPCLYITPSSTSHPGWQQQQQQQQQQQRTEHLLTRRRSCSASSRRASSTTACWSPSWRSCGRRRSGATSRPTTATCASASARPPGPSASPWSASTSAAPARSCTSPTRATSWATRSPASSSRASSAASASPRSGGPPTTSASSWARRRERRVVVLCLSFRRKNLTVFALISLSCNLSHPSSPGDFS